MQHHDDCVLLRLLDGLWMVQRILPCSSFTFEQEFLSTTCRIFFDSENFPCFSDDRFPLGLRASKISWIRGKPWVISYLRQPGVEGTHCAVPGSLIDWAAIVPTASLTSTSEPVAKLRTVTVIAYTMSCVTCEDWTDSNFFNSSFNNQPYLL